MARTKIIRLFAIFTLLALSLNFSFSQAVSNAGATGASINSKSTPTATAAPTGKTVPTSPAKEASQPKSNLGAQAITEAAAVNSATTWNPNKYVGVLYFIGVARSWLLYGPGSPNYVPGKWTYPHDGSNPNDPLAPGLGQEMWAGIPAGGQYQHDLPPAIERSMAQLNQTGVDFIIIDHTNSEIDIHGFNQHTIPFIQYLNSNYYATNRRFPKPVFLTKLGQPDRPQDDVQQLYNQYYSPSNSAGVNPNMFFKYGTKPLLLMWQANGCQASITGANGTLPISSYFECRHMTANKHGVQSEGWSFHDPYPQSIYYTELPEAMAVSAGQGNDPGFMSITPERFPALPQFWARGRNWDYRTNSNEGAQGQNFTDQWSLVHQYNPTFVVLGTWNLWTATRYFGCVDPPGWTTDTVGLIPGCNQTNDTIYVDSYSPKHSDMVEPIEGVYGDFYYQRMAQEIKQYKRNNPGFIMYNTNDGNWYIRDGGPNPSQKYAANNYTHVFTWPGSCCGSNYKPVTGDFNGDDRTDLALIDGSGTWYLAYYQSSSDSYANTRNVPWANTGGSDFVPFTGDFDGNGVTDLALYKKSTGRWIFQGIVGTDYARMPDFVWGNANYQPFAGDFNSDGKTDIGLIDPAGTWYFAFSNGNWTFANTRNFTWVGGVNSVYQPFAGDFDCDQKTDIGVRNTSNGTNHLANFNGVSLYGNADNYPWRAGSNYTLFVDIESCPATAATGYGLTATYYDNKDLTRQALVRNDGPVAFDWGGGAPDVSMGGDDFSVRWTGRIRSDATGNHTFHTVSDDGVRLWVNGQLIIDNWTDHPPTGNQGTIYLVAGTQYEIELEYYEAGGGALISLQWQTPGSPSVVNVPAKSLFPHPAITTNGLRATYYDGLNFTSPSSIVRNSEQISYDWGTNSPEPAKGSPDSSIGPDTFSVRWTGRIRADVTGNHTFHTVSDDGVRLWVNGQQIINNWTDHPPTDNYGATYLEAGKLYDIKLEYYENGVGAMIRLGWQPPGYVSNPGVPDTITRSNLYPGYRP